MNKLKEPITEKFIRELIKEAKDCKKHYSHCCFDAEYEEGYSSASDCSIDLHPDVLLAVIDYYRDQIKVLDKQMELLGGNE